MMKYEINGNIIEAESELSEAEIDEIAASFGSSDTGTTTPPDSTTLTSAMPAQPQAGIRESLINAGTRGLASIGGPIAEGAQLLKDAYQNREQINNAAPLAGGVIGGLAGAGVASIPLAALGGAAGEAFKQINNRLMGNEAPATSMDAAKAIGKEGAIQAAYDLGGAIVLKPLFGVAKFVGKPVASKLGAMGLDAVKKAQQLGMKLTPADMNGSGFWAAVEKFLQSTPGGSSILGEIRDNQAAILQKEYDRLLSEGAPQQTLEMLGMRIKGLAQTVADVGAAARTQGLEAIGSKTGQSLNASNQTMAQTGAVVKDLLDRKIASTKEEVRGLYQQHKKLMNPTTPIAPKNQLQETVDVFNEITKANPALQAKMKPVRDMAEQLSLEAKNGVTYERAYANRQALADMIQGEVNVLPNGAREVTPVGRQLTRLKEAIEKDLDDASMAAGGKVKDAFAKAKAAHASRQELLKNPVLKDLTRAQPEEVVGIAIQPNGVTTIRESRKLLGEANFNPVKDRFTSKLLGEGVFDPAKVASEMKRYGDETLAELYGKEQLTALKEVVKKANEYKALPVANEFVKTLLHKDPQNVLGYIIKKNNTENIKAAKRLMGKEQWEETVATWAQNTLKDPMTGQLSPDKAKQLLQLGDDTLFEAFGAAKFKEIKALSQLQTLLKAVEKKAGNPSGTARNLISMATLKDAVTSPISTGAKVVLPQIAAKAYTSNAATKYLTQGAFNVPKEAAPAAIAATKPMLQKIREYVDKSRM